MKKNKFFNKQQLFKIILTAILVALNVILERFFAYSVWSHTISFGFITVAFAASFLGVPYAIAVAGLGDLIGAILFPFGAYFPGYTFTNCVYGFIMAMFIYKHATAPNIVLSVVLNKIVCTLGLNTLWTAILYQSGIKSFPAVFILRLPTACVMGTVEIIVLSLIFSNDSKVRKIFNKNFSKIF